MHGFINHRLDGIHWRCFNVVENDIIKIIINKIQSDVSVYVDPCLLSFLELNLNNLTFDENNDDDVKNNINKPQKHWTGHCGINLYPYSPNYKVVFLQNDVFTHLFEFNDYLRENNIDLLKMRENFFANIQSGKLMHFMGQNTWKLNCNSIEKITEDNISKNCVINYTFKQPIQNIIQFIQLKKHWNKEYVYLVKGKLPYINNNENNVFDENGICFSMGFFGIKSLYYDTFYKYNPKLHFSFLQFNLCKNFITDGDYCIDKWLLFSVRRECTPNYYNTSELNDGSGEINIQCVLQTGFMGKLYLIIILGGESGYYLQPSITFNPNNESSKKQWDGYKINRDRTMMAIDLQNSIYKSLFGRFYKTFFTLFVASGQNKYNHKLNGLDMEIQHSEQPRQNYLKYFDYDENWNSHGYWTPEKPLGYSPIVYK